MGPVQELNTPIAPYLKLPAPQSLACPPPPKTYHFPLVSFHSEHSEGHEKQPSTHFSGGPVTALNIGPIHSPAL